MSKAFKSIKRGLKQAVQHRKGERVAGLRVRALRGTRQKVVSQKG